MALHFIYTLLLYGENAMKNTISFLFTNHLYKGRITYQRACSIITSYGFTLFEYDLSAENEELELLRSFNLMNYAQVMPCFTYIFDAQHKYVFIRSGETEKDKTHMLLHEAGHIYNEHFTTEELVHNTPYTKERQADLFSSTMLFLNRASRAFPCLIAIAIIVGILFAAIPGKDPSREDASDIVYYTESGEVYHLFEDCYHLKDLAIVSGTIDDSGKDRVCKTCEDRAEEE